MAQGNPFRGSAAFFAMLLAASSAAAPDGPGIDNGQSDQTGQASPYALAGKAPVSAPASKFTRRRLLLAPRLPGAPRRG